MTEKWEYAGRDLTGQTPPDSALRLAIGITHRVCGYGCDRPGPQR